MFITNDLAFFAPFLTHLGSKFPRSANMTHIFVLLQKEHNGYQKTQNFMMGSSPFKKLKKTATKKLAAKNFFNL